MGEWEVMSGQVAESQPERLAVWLPSEWLNPGETGITADQRVPSLGLAGQALQG